mmetsp:Transcript_89156/g.277160  ORF Transcript_89156/g.277160 Transcript_89156/m.277160 type:complete len:298 (+) Transcript_89156:99-992(+)|eukprot:CAMPEP_0204570376 /NCGR_PEP_ID=MMETSP0661-20131031/38282_1 /ASSEMBLY_ACC=CAM_ASM_000606 /TAXON_ID=109239 /ORGANISM="Alexandrium margalefi, Strain AMGDE01CS-322" /LENGTH=297 /DNA_ID=CAMNT_0051578557 /DNA_START=79 /DNA_END=972 /DNA_ORIENTATION=+
MEIGSRRRRHIDAADIGVDGTVVFDVRGVPFKVLGQTILARPSTLLANLLDDIDSDASKPIFVDANPDRFNHILDWYQYGEMFVPAGCPIPAVLRDACFFLLPDAVKINGSSYAIRPASADTVRDATASVVIAAWPNFERYVEGLIRQVQDDLLRLAETAADPREAESDRFEIGGHNLMLFGSEFGYKEFELSKRHIRRNSSGQNVASWGWTDPANVCSEQRLWILAAELEKRGFACELSSTNTEGYPVCSAAIREGIRLRVRVPRDDTVAMTGSSGFRLAGVNTVNGRLRVSSRHE